MVHGLQGYLKDGFKLIDTTTEYLSSAGYEAAPIGALGGICGFTVALILGGDVIATTVGCATIVFAAIVINNLVKKIVLEGYWYLGDHRLDKQIVVKSAMFVTFALLNLPHFKSMTGLSVVTTLAVYPAYQKLRPMAEKKWCGAGDKE
jgi:hypothetical protein